MRARNRMPKERAGRRRRDCVSGPPGRAWPAAPRHERSQRNMKHTQDHFSAIAAQYALGRIAYPEDLYRFLVAQCHGQDLAWDCPFVALSAELLA